MCLEFHTQIPRSFGGPLFQRAEGGHTATGSFSKDRGTRTVPTHGAVAALCPHLCPTQPPPRATGMERCLPANLRPCRQTPHTRDIFPACLFLPTKLFPAHRGTKPAVERFSRSALLCRRKRYFNSALNKFCPFTCVRIPLNKLRSQDLAPRHRPNKSGLTDPGEGRGPRGKHIWHKAKSLPEPGGQNGLVFITLESAAFTSLSIYFQTLLLL